MSLMRSTCLRIRTCAWCRVSERCPFGARQLRGEPDDIQRIFEVMDDGPRELADHRQPLSLDHLAQILAVELPQAIADLRKKSKASAGDSSTSFSMSSRAKK